jgi:hypothetical protein
LEQLKLNKLKINGNIHGLALKLEEMKESKMIDPEFFLALKALENDMRTLHSRVSSTETIL